MCRLMKSEVLMEIAASIVQEIIGLTRRARNGGIQVDDSHLPKFLFERFIKHAPCASSLFVPVHVNRKLHIPVAGASSYESPGVGIADDPAFIAGGKVRILSLRVLYAASEFFRIGRYVLEGDSRLFHIRTIDGRERLCVFFRHFSDRYIHISSKK